ncbi:pyridoxal-phosphate dependent enzyme [Rhodococcoides yunnanense]|uniref:Pyridoxal-phosphate dependent enzyme n=1 Tax=Rhodococcoides yunnanense TaxID=278209 RepID=A0ABU4BKH0_9NOCA|nr:pyridoxal-phosphate dependent enzyme [Rhodococcus yunnanensis]MDV6264578.1 pyridoxal-phosphate dependent enzyme [Rhodococcus yunnanensis]
MTVTDLPAVPVQLASWPTPLEHAPRLAEAIGLGAGDLWLKRDDLTGLAGGGNKIRKLEWTLAAALADGADTIVTTGAPQSNHARLTAAAAARVGLDAVLVFPGNKPEGAPAGNLLLDAMLGAEIVWAGDTGSDASVVDVAEAVAQRLRSQRRRPALIPFGGSNAVGAHGYRLAGVELLGQLSSTDVVVCAVGSGGTMAGLVAGLGVNRVLGVHTGAVADPRATVGRLLCEMGEEVDPESLRIRMDQVGDGYETLTDSAYSALTTAAQAGGIILDPVYTARAFAGLTAEVAQGHLRPGTSVVFLASGGLPGLFGHEGVRSADWT